MSEFNKEINKLYLVRTNSGESSTRRLEDTEASTSTMANEVRSEADIPHVAEMRMIYKTDGNSSSKGLESRKRRWKSLA